jgi:heptosyltransferase I
VKILIVKTSSMGDVVHAMPAISDIAANVPGAQVDWLVEAPFAALPAMHPAVRRVIPIAWRRWRKSLWQTSTRAEVAAANRALRVERYDLVLDLQGLIKSALWATRAYGPRAGYDAKSARESLAALFYSRTASVDTSMHAVERSRHLVAHHLRFPSPSSKASFGLVPPGAAGWLPQPTRYAVLITGASRPEKLWPEASWIAVAERLKARELGLVWLWGSAEEGERARRLAAAAGGEVPPFLSVADATAILARASVCVGLDTGFTHIAAAFGVATVGIYCDHEPGLVGITGEGYVASVGGRAVVPSVDAVSSLLPIL